MERLHQLAGEVVDGLLELVYPTRCAGCDLPGHLICPACVELLAGQATLEPHIAGLDAVRCAGPLERPLSRILTVYKDGNERRLASPLGDLLADRAASWLGRADSIVWIPASRRAVARRGFDHAERIALRMGELSGCRAVRALEPVRSRDQRGLGRAARASNVQGAFAVSQDTALTDRVLLVDDVVTTGATLASAADVLRRSGAREVRAVTLAIKL